MKALIVSDSHAEGQAIRHCLENEGYNTINYRWLLKALDNVEEIEPQLVVINAIDYPLHWKVMVQHMKFTLCCQPDIVLLVPPSLDDEEIEKIEYLGILCCITSTEEQQLKKLTESIITTNTCAALEKTEEGKILFIHPTEGTLYSGKTFSFGENLLEFTPDRPITLNIGDKILDGSIKTAHGIATIKAEVIETEPELTLVIN